MTQLAEDLGLSHEGLLDSQPLGAETLLKVIDALDFKLSVFKADAELKSCFVRKVG